MAIERQFRYFAQRLDHRWTNGKVGHEMAVHDIDMNNADSACAGGTHLFPKTGEVRGKNRGC